MKLPISLPIKKKGKPQYYLALLLREEKVSAVIFEELEGKARVLGEHEEYFADSIEVATHEEWLDLLDKTISTAESSLPDNVETQNTIFGLKETWIEETRIKKQHLIKLKKISEALGLIPKGFLVVTEAIAHLLQKEEGAPVSAIIVEIGKKNITISLLRAGRIIEVKSSPIEHSVVQTTDALLHHFTRQEVLPARMILFNGNKTEELAQKFITHTWSKSLPFLHVPQITTLPKGFDARAVLVGAAGQMGFEVLNEEDLQQGVVEKYTGHKAAPAVEEKPDSDEAASNAVNEEDEKEATSVSNAAEANVAEGEGESLEDVGFVRDVDVLAQRPLITKKGGVLVDVDDEKLESTSSYEEEAQEETADADAHWPAKGHGKKNISAALVAGIAPLLSIFKKSARMIGKKGFIPKGINPALALMLFTNKFFLAAFAVLIIGIIGVVLYITQLKATVVLAVSPKVVEKEQDVVFTTAGATDVGQNTIAAEEVSVSEDGSVSTAVSGKKEVGEKAKGSVTILSSLTKEQSLPAGTVIDSANRLSFVLDDTIKIASSSGLSDIKSAKGAVTASEIGKEYNLPSDTKFSVQGFDSSQLQGKNEAAFAGGSKKDVTVVAKEDIDKVTADLPKNLEAKAKEKLEKDLSSDNALLPFFTDTTVTKKEYDKKLGEEAKSLTLKGTVSFASLAYKKANAQEFAKKLVEQEAKDMQLKNSDIAVAIKDIQQKKDKTITAKLSIKASLLPKVDTASLTKKIAGKSYEEAKNIFQEIPQLSDMTVTLNPSLPFLPKVLPRLSQNITITVGN